MSAIRLYELADALERLTEQLIDNGGELTPEIAAELEALEGTFDDRIERLLLHARNLQAVADAAAQEAGRLTALAGTRARAAERLKTYVLESMERAGRPKVETPLVKARIQANSRPSIQWFGPVDAIPEEFRRVTVSIDAQKAYETWKATGQLPDGFIVERGRHLRVQ